RFTTDYADLAHAEVHFLGRGTPQRADGFGADLSHLDAAVASLAQVLPARDGAPTLVVGKSTVPAGTARLLAERLAPVDGAYLLWNPEFLREGFAVQDTLDPDRLVYGVHEPGTPAAERAVAMLDRVYAGVLEREAPRLVMGYEAAELVKASANAFLATKISFINAVSEMCEATGADVTDVARAIGMDERIGSKFLPAGVGFGGGCRPKDTRAFMASAEQHGVGRRWASSARSTPSTSAAAPAWSRSPARCSATSPAAGSPCWARRSSPTATTPATPRRSTSPAASEPPAPWSPSPTRRRWTTRGAAS